MPAFVNDNLIWIVAAVVLAAALLSWVMRSGKTAELPEAEASAAAPAVVETAGTAPTPAGELTAIGVPAAVGPPDDLLLLKGVGPKLNTMLTGFGITRFDQIAAWRDADIAKVDANLGTFQGRIARDNWIEQAGLLASGEIAAFEAKFGKLDGQIA